MTDRLLEVAYKWIDVLSSELIFVPLVGGWAFGYIVSLCPRVKNMKRQSDRAFYVYFANAIGAVSLFILINIRQDIITIMSMLIFVGGSSVIIPYIYFTYIKRTKRV